IAQEALRNICKHAEATRVDAVLDFFPDSVRMTVKDNGKGFDLPRRLDDLPATGRLGLVGMEERAELLGGSLRVESRRGAGTAVTVEVKA
ncbi:MAG: sensor histidine kinase, partial [Gemmatimonadetes bacterium]|nr:sensor histidine kinase [Gemmatimonadota bacterium]